MRHTVDPMGRNTHPPGRPATHPPITQPPTHCHSHPNETESPMTRMFLSVVDISSGAPGLHTHLPVTPAPAAAAAGACVRERENTRARETMGRHGGSRDWVRLAVVQDGGWVTR